MALFSKDSPALSGGIVPALRAKELSVLEEAFDAHSEAAYAEALQVVRASSGERTSPWMIGLLIILGFNEVGGV